MADTANDATLRPTRPVLLLNQGFLELGTVGEVCILQRQGYPGEPPKLRGVQLSPLAPPEGQRERVAQYRVKLTFTLLQKGRDTARATAADSLSWTTSRLDHRPFTVVQEDPS